MDAHPFHPPELWRKLPFRARRESSWSRDGYNRDYIFIEPHQSCTVADLSGPGAITHLWFAIDNGFKVSDPLFLRKTVLRIVWEDADYPSVDVPVGDFFGVGHGEVRSYTSALLEMSVNPGYARGSFNSWIQMPFQHRARIALHNQSDERIRTFFHVDFQSWESLPADLYHLHASWRCEMPCAPTPLGPDGQEGANLTGDGNYVILDAAGEGSYIGCNLSVDNHAGGWWGEGDDMIFVDGEPFPGSLHGTGTEEAFGQAWGMQNVCYPYYGTSLFNEGHRNWEGRWTMYRFYLLDPIPFRSQIRVTVEHGHNNHRSDDYASTAYWYQLGVHPVPALPPAEARLPRA